MNRIPVFGLLLLSLVTGFVAARLASTREAHAAGYAYRVLEMNPWVYMETQDWKNLRKQYKDDREATAPFKEYVLNTLAEEGWELYSMEPGKGGTLVTYYFRKSK